MWNRLLLSDPYFSILGHRQNYNCVLTASITAILNVFPQNTSIVESSIEGQIERGSLGKGHCRNLLYVNRLVKKEKSVVARCFFRIWYLLKSLGNLCFMYLLYISFIGYALLSLSRGTFYSGYFQTFSKCKILQGAEREAWLGWRCTPTLRVRVCDSLCV